LDIELVDPVLRPAMQRTPTLDIENRFVLLGGPVSRLAPGKRIDGVARRVVRDGAVNVRIYTPANANGSGLLWIHGGGLVIGSARMDDRLCGETAQQLGVTVVSVDYRLAPKHPFPAAIDDCHAAWRWLGANGCRTRGVPGPAPARRGRDGRGAVAVLPDAR
jgi:acetyl esterase/lipase